jgi:hypothetical protein
MPRKPKKNRLAENIGDFAGPDADRENIEKLAKAAADNNAKIGHNGGDPPDEVIKRNADAIEVALVEIDAALRIVQTARAGLAVARKNAKTDFGSKSWVDSVEAAVKLKRAAEKGGSGEIVTEHRQMGRILRLLDTPLGHQFGLFDVGADKDDPVVAKPAMDAELQGQHAWANNEPISNNPFTPGSEEFVAWETGHNNAMAAHARKMAPNGDAASH